MYLLLELCYLAPDVLQILGVFLASLRELRLSVFVLPLPGLQLRALVQELSLQGVHLASQARALPLHSAQLALEHPCFPPPDVNSIQAPRMQPSESAFYSNHQSHDRACTFSSSWSLFS